MATADAVKLLETKPWPEALVIGSSITILLTAYWVAHRLGWWLHRLSRLEPHVNRRGAHRVLLSAPVFVYGWTKGNPFFENTRTVNVSASGGLIPLSARVVRSQILLIINRTSNEDSTCQVTRLDRFSHGARVVGFEFVPAADNFWQVEFIHGSGPAKSTAGPAS